MKSSWVLAYRCLFIEVQRKRERVVELSEGAIGADGDSQRRTEWDLDAFVITALEILVQGL